MDQQSLATQSTAKASASERAQALNELTKVVDSAQEELARARTVFPFDLFPDTVTVDRTQVVIIQRSFFFVGGTTSIRLEDILNVTANVGPFFGSIKISTRYFDPDKPYEVRRLWREDALRVQAIVQGLIIATQKEIDTTVFNRRELVKGLTKVGQTPPYEGV